MNKPHTVVVIIEAKAGKEAELKTALEAVVAPSRAEESNIEYRLHETLDNPRQFILYENWQSQELHQQQLEKPYIQSLVEQSEELLVKPPQIYFGVEL